MANLVDKFIERHIAAGMKDPRKSSVPRFGEDVAAYLSRPDSWGDAPYLLAAALQEIEILRAAYVKEAA